MAEKIYEGTRFKGGSWRFRIKMTLPNGTKINREKAGFKSSYEAYQARIEEIGRIKLTNFVEKNITLNEMYGLFLEESATKQKSYNTVLRYNSIYNNHIRNGLGEMYVGRIQSLDITHFLNEKAEQYKTDYPLSMYNFFLVLFDFARKHKYINEDIMALVERPRPYARPEKVLLTPEEFNSLEQRLLSTNVQVPFTISKNSGLRASEVYALRWSDIDFENKTFEVKKQLQKREIADGKKVWCLVPVKTPKSERVVYMGEEFAEYLQFVKKMQEENKKRLGKFYKSNTIKESMDKFHPELGEVITVEDFVCVKENGEMLSPDSNKVISRIAKDMGLEFNFHMLRHYFASSLQQNGVDITVIRDCLGHSNLRTLLEVYSHCNEEQRRSAGALIDTIMGAKNLMPETLAE